MSELCLSTTWPRIYSFLVSDLYLLCCFILSHPLYFSYFIFFSPYILKLFSFLSPLLITTSLLLLALLTIHGRFKYESCNFSILFSLYHSVLETLESLAGDRNDDEELRRLEDFELYKMVFQENSIEFLEYTAAEVSEKPVLDFPVQENATVDLENSGENSGELDEKKFEDFLKELDEFESSVWSDNVKTKKIEPLGTKVDKVVEKQKEVMIMGNGSKKEGTTADKVKKTQSWNDLDYNNSNGVDQNLEYSLGSYGSMRKEKEWKRTLACKLYEERHNAIDTSGDGMDLLWETYELDAAKSKVKKDNNNNNKTKKKNKKKAESKSYKKDQEEEEDEEDMNGQLCCLQALRFSTGKMNLGMGRPNLVKISKAIRGYGWLHHVSKKNKVHCGD